jgi:hypothetical protein
LFENTAALDGVIGCINDITAHKVKQASFDLTKAGLVKEVLGNSYYVVTIQGADYSVPCITGQIFNIGKTVFVMFPQNNLSSGMIIGGMP